MKHSIFGLATIFSLLFVLSTFFVGCANEEMEVDNPVTSHSIPVNFHATLTAFDANQVPDTRATALTWKDGDVIYLQYTASDNSYDKAILTYSAGEWTISYEKNFKRDASTKCVAYYFDGDYTINNASITLSPTTGVYADLDATYVYPMGGELTITCNLKPQTSRIRFKGTPGTAFTLEGIECIADVNAKTAAVTKSSAANTFTVGSDGYSPYIYGNFASSIQPKLMVSLCHYAYMTDCRGLGMLVTGKSGYLTLPTPDEHNGWEAIKEEIGDHPYVDLGLSVRWATMNVGASVPEDYGDYFAWGETKPKSTYSWSNYFDSVDGSSSDYKKYYNFNKGGKITLDFEDDAAHVNWGGNWRMPTFDEVEELCNNCSWTWITLSGVKGYKVTSKSNGNFIFFPAAGYRYEDSLYGVGSYGGYWSGMCDTSVLNGACCLGFGSGGVGGACYSRCYGLSIRAVCQ